jgi:hypothetical protein
MDTVRWDRLVAEHQKMMFVLYGVSTGVRPRSTPAEGPMTEQQDGIHAAKALMRDLMAVCRCMSTSGTSAWT